MFPGVFIHSFRTSWRGTKSMTGGGKGRSQHAGSRMSGTRRPTPSYKAWGCASLPKGATNRRSQDPKCDPKITLESTISSHQAQCRAQQYSIGCVDLRQRHDTLQHFPRPFPLNEAPPPILYRPPPQTCAKRWDEQRLETSA